MKHMKIHTFRLKPGSDLKREIEAFAKRHNIEAGFVITCVAGLSQATIRMAGAAPDKQDIRTLTEDFEVTSLVGTVSIHGVHLHIALSNREGQGLGGHLKEGTIIQPTAEIVIGEDGQTVYRREFDADTGFDELTVNRRS